MTDLRLAQLGAALMAAATPWIVVRVALATAARHSPSLPQPFRWPVTARRLRLATAFALPAVSAPALWLPARPGGLQAAGLTAFVVLAGVALRALHEIDEVTRPARDLSAATRLASLTPRRVDQYLTWPWRLAPFGVVMAGLAAFLWRLAAPLPDRRLFSPVLFAAVALVFLWLYEVWIHDLVAGPVAAGASDAAELEARRRRQVRVLHRVELGLVTLFLALAHALLDLDWRTHPRWGAAASLAGGLAGVLACALAISSDLNRRRYLAAPEPP
jgi:hypothetical protein